jgi:hypothetical protein
VLRQSRDIENLMYDLQRTGRNSMKKLQLPRGAVPVLVLTFFVSHSMMEKDQGFANFVQGLLYVREKRAQRKKSWCERAICGRSGKSRGCRGVTPEPPLLPARSRIRSDAHALGRTRVRPHTRSAAHALGRTCVRPHMRTSAHAHGREELSGDPG